MSKDEIKLWQRDIYWISAHFNLTNSMKTRSVTVTGCATAVSFCCKGYITMLNKAKMQENTDGLKFKDFNFYPNMWT